MDMIPSRHVACSRIDAEEIPRRSFATLCHKGRNTAQRLTTIDGVGERFVEENNSELRGAFIVSGLEEQWSYSEAVLVAATCGATHASYPRVFLPLRAALHHQQP
jgi:hypothetical protein